MQYKGLIKTQNSSFLNKTTNSKGKTDSEAWQDARIGATLRALNRRVTGHAVILVGDTSGLFRHLKRMKALGFKESQVIIFEWTHALAVRLKSFVKKHGLRCHIIEGDLIAGCYELANQGYRIHYVEFDGVQCFGTAEPLIYKMIRALNIPVLVTQGSGRRQHDGFKEFCRQRGFRRRTTHDDGRKPSYVLTETAPSYVRAKLRGFKHDFKTYGGRRISKGNATPMYMSISIDSKLSI